MTALWIILAVALVLTVLNLLPVGVDAAYVDDVFSLAARIGPFRLRLLPKPPDAKPKKKKPPKPKKEKPKKKSAPPDIRTILALAKLGLQALNRFRQRLRVQRLRLVFVSGAPDPYDTALAFGYVNAALGALTPLAERALRIDERDNSDRRGFSGRAAAYRRAHRLHDPHRADRRHRAGVRRWILKAKNALETGPGRARKDRTGHAGKEGQQWIMKSVQS